MSWARIISVAAHVAVIGWLYHLSTLPTPVRVDPPALLAELVEPIYTPPPPPPPPPPLPEIEPPKEIPKEIPKPRRARVRPRAAPEPPPSAEPDRVEPLPIPSAPPAPPDAPIEPTDTFITDPEPIYRPKPEYPERALRFKREGVVELEFTIAVDGSVQNVLVIKSEPEGLFDRAATRALAKWRYAPQLVNGVAIERTKVRVRLIFKLDKA
jgi:protein TonB